MSATVARCADCQLAYRRAEITARRVRIAQSSGPPAPLEADPVDEPFAAGDERPDADARDLDALAADVDQVEPVPEQPPARTYPERRCAITRCLKRFVPTHPEQRVCPSCRGLRVERHTEPTKTSTSWWVNARSRDQFREAAKDQEDRMKGSKEKFHVPNRILGEKS